MALMIATNNRKILRGWGQTGPDGEMLRKPHEQTFHDITRGEMTVGDGSSKAPEAA